MPDDRSNIPEGERPTITRVDPIPVRITPPAPRDARAPAEKPSPFADPGPLVSTEVSAIDRLRMAINQLPTTMLKKILNAKLVATALAGLIVFILQQFDVKVGGDFQTELYGVLAVIAGWFFPRPEELGEIKDQVDRAKDKGVWK